MADGAQAYQNGLLIDGYVTTGPQGTPVYTGSDPYLLEHYGPVDLLNVWDQVPGAVTGEEMRGAS